MEEVRKAVPAMANMRRGEGRQGGEGREGGEAREGRRGNGEGGRRGGLAAAGGGAEGGGMPVMRTPGGGVFTAKDLENAKLPPPVEEGSQLDVLLRPGLLADVEIILEKFPNAIHVPNQAVFEKDGKQIVYVRKSDGRWEERVVKPLKRSESVMVIASGVKQGEVVAISNPTARPGDKKKDKPGSASPMGGMGAGGGRS
jgi:HlyD family secretion protein